MRAGYSQKRRSRQALKTCQNLTCGNISTNCLRRCPNSALQLRREVMETLTRVMRREEEETVVVTIKTHKSWYDENGKKQILDTEEPVCVKIPPS